MKEAYTASGGAPLLSSPRNWERRKIWGSHFLIQTQIRVLLFYLISVSDLISIFSPISHSILGIVDLDSPFYFQFLNSGLRFGSSNVRGVLEESSISAVFDFENRSSIGIADSEELREFHLKKKRKCFPFMSCFEFNFFPTLWVNILFGSLLFVLFFWNYKVWFCFLKFLINCWKFLCLWWIAVGWYIDLEKLAPQRRSQRHMGGQMQQSNAAAATALYDHTGGGGGSLHNAGPASDAGDAVMARWLQSAGLQHLASPLASTGIDNRLLPNLLMQVLHLLHLIIF